MVVTHHGPSKVSQHTQFEMDEFSACFWSELDDLVQQADLWIYGHSHSNLDVMLGKCRLVSNQSGYPGEPAANRQLFNPAWVVEV